jgi:hypothetical protein
MTRVNARLGLTQTEVGWDELWGTTTTTVTSQIKYGRHHHAAWRGPLSKSSAAYAAGLMSDRQRRPDWA